MKPLIKLLPIYLFLFAACQRQPTANFTTDKTEYQAGDTVHLKNSSEYGKHFIWTMPDGSTQTTTDATYIIPDTTLYSNFTFKLQALSSKEKKSNEKSVTVLGMIRPKREKDSFSIGNIIYKNMGGAEHYNQTDTWDLISWQHYSSGFSSGVRIIFASNYQNVKSGIYELQPTNNNLTGNEAYLVSSYGCSDCIPQGSQNHIYIPRTGKIVMTIEYLDDAKINAKINVIYNDIEASVDSTNTTIKISGNILTSH